MRAVVALTLVAAAAHADWVNLTDQDFAAAWKPVAGIWTSTSGVIAGSDNEQAAVLLSTADYYNFELELEFKKEGSATGALGLHAHWLPDAPSRPGGAVPIAAAPHLYGLGCALDAPSRIGQVFETLDDAARSLAPVDEPQNAWSKLRVTAREGTIELAQNGARVSYHDQAFIGGRIALILAPRARIQFRNIRINDHGREGTWRSLFNGRDFTGWKIWGTEEWTVEDGVIIGRSGPKKSEGYLATEETWKDFRVRGKFKMLGDGNFGLFYHSSIAYNEEQYPVISGLQGEVAPGYPSPTGWIYESYKRGWLVQPDMTSYRAYALRPDDWNEIEIQSTANHVTTWVNGIQVLDLTDPDQQLTEGSFALQLHAGGVDGIEWKDLYVLEK
jgi:hypothetical protein